MKATEKQISALHAQIVAARAQCALSDAEIGEISGVHPSQVSRICRGKFKTISHNVMQICNTLGRAVDSLPREPTGETASWAKIEASLRSLWDRTPEGAEKLVRVLDTIGALRKE
jgi:predicted XRE-type DNA-binding protein